MDNPFVEVVDLGFLGRLLSDLLKMFFEFSLGVGDDFFDSGGVDAAVGDEPVEGEAGHFASDHVESADDHDAWRVVDDDVDAGGFLEGADIASFASDDPALHFVVGDIDRAGGGFGRMGGGIALQRGKHDLARLFLAGLGESLFMLHDERARLVLELLVEHFEQASRGFFLAEPAEFMKGLALEVEKLGEFLISLFGVLNSLSEFSLGALDDLLLLAEMFRLLFEGVLSLVEAAFADVQFLTELAEFLLAFGFALDSELFEFEFHFAATVLHLASCLGGDSSGFCLGVPASQVIEQFCEPECEARRDYAGHDGCYGVSHGYILVAI